MHSNQSYLKFIASKKENLIASALTAEEKLKEQRFRIFAKKYSSPEDFSNKASFAEKQYFKELFPSDNSIEYLSAALNSINRNFRYNQNDLKEILINDLAPSNAAGRMEIDCVAARGQYYAKELWYWYGQTGDLYEADRIASANAGHFYIGCVLANLGCE